MRQIISANFVKAIYLDRELLLKKLNEIARESAKKFPQIKKIILFGSLAKNEETGLSDVDLFILVEDGESNPLKRLKRYFDFFADRLDIALDMIVANVSEFDYYKEMLKNCIVLYDKDNEKQ